MTGFLKEKNKMNSKIFKVKRPLEFEDTQEDIQYQEELAKLTGESFADASFARTLKNIKETLSKGLKRKYAIKDKNELTDKVNQFLKLHGLREQDFDVMNRVADFMSSKINDLSIDANANKNEKCIRGILKEAENSFDKLTGFDYLYRTAKELYGQDEAKRLSVEMYDLSLGISDSTCILIPYCWSLDASKIVITGRDFGVLPSKPAKSIHSYIGALNETVHQFSNQLAGAIAVGSFFLDLSHILMYKQFVPLKKLKEDKAFRKIVENALQGFIHSMNSLSRNGGIESPFSNVSIFDKEKLKNFLSDDNYGWYFPKRVKILADNELGGEDCKISNEEFKDFVADYIFEVQKIFIDLFDRGDPVQNGLQYRFPVVTVNMSKHWIESEGVFDISDDNELLSYISHKDIARYNLFTSEGTKIASCCRMINNKDMMDKLGSVVNSFGGSGGISLGSHRVVTINFARIAYEAQSYDNYLEILKERVQSAAKILKAHKVLLYKLADMGVEPFIKNGWINMKRMFSTFGVLGIVEADEILKNRFNHTEFDYVKDILKRFNVFCQEAAQVESIASNIEQIPAESMAPRFAKSDSILFNNPYKFPDLYANQFIPLWKDVSIYEKMDREGEMDKYLSGGSIAHIQIGSEITPAQRKKLVHYATRAGLEHFALNAVYSRCENEKCGNVWKANFDKCPDCGFEEVTKFTRVVGFFTPVSSWAPERRVWEFPRRKFIDINVK
jgi:ribonucleoside-triphosphate reductase